MDLFLMQRYWSDEEETNDDLKKNNSGEIAKQLKAKLKKRKSKDSDVKEKDASLTPQVEEKGDDEETDGASKAKKKKTRKKKKKSTEAEGFTVLGGDSSFSGAGGHAVRRVLPSWLANPDVVSVDFSEEQLSVDDLQDLLDGDMVTKLKGNGIAHFFPVQRQIIPWLLRRQQDVFFRPSDICVSAPTGSGKTLAFVVPIVQALRSRVVPRIRALVILPVQDLAAQVCKVFQAYSEGTGLRVKMLTSQKSFAQEQGDLVRPGVTGEHHSMVDILVATAGRLVDHIQKTEGFSLRHLRYLVIDEADRVMDGLQNDWLTHVESAVYSGDRTRPGPLNVANAFDCSTLQQPLQKLLFSATLSQNPEQLQQLNLYEPKLFSSVVKPKDILQTAAATASAGDDDCPTGKYTTPAELKESFVTCKDGRKKPQVLHHLIKSMGMRKTLVFTKSVEHTHFLAALLSAYGLSVAELSSQVQQKRGRVLNQFSSGKKDVLVCTDALARGIDIGLIDFVVSYDCPPFVKTYIHRVGRTARAGVPGSAITLLEKKEKRDFQSMMKETGKGSIDELEVDEAKLDDLAYENACKAATLALEAEKKVSKEKKHKGSARKKSKQTT